MALRVVLKLDVGDDKTLENCDKTAQAIYSRFQQENPDLKGVRWNIDLGNGKYALGAWLF